MVLVALVAVSIWGEKKRRVRWAYFREQAEAHAEREQTYRTEAASDRQRAVWCRRKSEAQERLMQRGGLAEGRLLDGEEDIIFHERFEHSKELQSHATDWERSASRFLNEAAEEARLKRGFLSRW
jgi:hypothetical protein